MVAFDWLARAQWAVQRIAILADGEQPLIKRIDPDSRARLLLALAGMVILAIGGMVLVWLGARYVKRIARQRPPERQRDLSDWQRPEGVERHGTTDEHG